MSEADRRFADLYRAHDVYSRFPTEHRQEGSFPVDFTRVQQGDFEATDPATHEFLLGVALGERGGRLDVDFGEGRQSFDHAAAAFYLNPTSSEVDYRQVGRIDLLFLSAPIADIAERLEMEAVALARALRPLHDRMGTDPRVRAQALALWEHAAAGGPFAALAVDHGLLALAASLMHRARTGERVLAEPPPRLDDARMRRVVEHVEARLAEPIRLDELAALACYSTFHFSRAFKAAAGRSPHAYVTARRVERAKTLLADPALPLAQVAYVTGFASQSHLGAVFKAHTGATPGAWRAAVLG